MDEYMELMKALIRCRPVSGDPAAVNKANGVLKSFLESHGLFCTLENTGDRTCLYASTRPGKVQDLLLNSHVDVVPAVSEEEYEPIEKNDGWIYGRGTADCEGNTACVAKILCAVKDHASVGAVFSSDEEIGGDSVRAMVKLGYRARKACIVLDAWQDHKIITRHKGLLSIRISAHGPGGHSSRPWGKANPIDMLVDAYVKIRSLWAESDDPSAGIWRNSMAPCIIRSGVVDNQIPTDGELVLNFRYLGDDDYEKIVELVKSSGLEVTILRTRDPLATDENAAAVQMLKQTIEDVLRRPSGFSKVCGASDGCHLKAIGVPVVIMGVNGINYHGEGEKMELKTLDELYRILTEYIGRLEKLKV